MSNQQFLLSKSRLDAACALRTTRGANGLVFPKLASFSGRRLDARLSQTRVFSFIIFVRWSATHPRTLSMELMRE